MSYDPYKERLEDLCSYDSHFSEEVSAKYIEDRRAEFLDEWFEYSEEEETDWPVNM